MAEYSLPPGPHPDYEVDHLIPLGLGGADDDKNLWAEPRRSIEKEWPAEKMDELERRLRELVYARRQGRFSRHHKPPPAVREKWFGLIAIPFASANSVVA